MASENGRLGVLRERLTYANVIATLALFVALGGGAYAAINLPRDSVGSKQIKASAVKNEELADAAVTDTKLAPGSVTLSALGANSVDTDKIVDGSISPADLAPGESPNSPTLEDCVAGTPWTAVGGGLAPHYWLDRDGIVHLEGAVSCGGDATEGGLIFNMPVTYRPSGNAVKRYAVLGGGTSLAQLAVVNTGVGAGLVFDAGTMGSTTDDYVSLDGITYRIN